jgi:hypothetical protein
MTFFPAAHLMPIHARTNARPVRLRRSSPTQETLFLFQVPRLGITLLSPPCCASAGIRAIALTMVATATQVEPTSALLAPDCPNSYLHGLAQDKSGTGRRLGNMQQTERRSRPRDRHRGREVVAPVPNSQPPTKTTKYISVRPFSRTNELPWLGHRNTTRLALHQNMPISIRDYEMAKSFPRNGSLRSTYHPNQSTALVDHFIGRIGSLFHRR